MSQNPRTAFAGQSPIRKFRMWLGREDCVVWRKEMLTARPQSLISVDRPSACLRLFRTNSLRQRMKGLTALRALTSIGVLTALIAFGPRLGAAGQAGFASLSGTASSASGRSLADTVVRLRNVTSGQLAGSTTSNVAGQFRFPNLSPGTYAVEVVSPSGQLVGVSQAVPVGAGKTITGVAVTAATQDVAVAGANAAAAAGPSTGAITASVIAAAAGLGAAVAVNANVSPSR
jgi:hypothetical protein